MSHQVVQGRGPVLLHPGQRLSRCLSVREARQRRCCRRPRRRRRLYPSLALTFALHLLRQKIIVSCVVCCATWHGILQYYPNYSEKCFGGILSRYADTAGGQGRSENRARYAICRANASESSSLQLSIVVVAKPLLSHERRCTNTNAREKRSHRQRVQRGPRSL